jgi:hypothetical protein
MVSPSTPATLAEIAVGAEPSTRTVVAVGHRSGVLSASVFTNHDPPSTAIGVAESRRPADRPPALTAAAIGTNQDSAHR